MMEESFKILVMSGAFPSSKDPSRGIFVKERVKALSQLPGVEVQVLSPVPSILGAFRAGNTPEMVDGLKVYRPHYFMVPKLGGYIHPQLIYPFAYRVAAKLRNDFPFDLIDAHFVYAGGVAATRIAMRLGVPVCLTGRGEDMLRFPSYPIKGRSIRWALRNANGFVGVSQEISEAMIKNGADPQNTSTIPNGVDTAKFRRISKQQCRHQLGLPPDAKILITVGDRIELKGFHVVIQSLPQILRQVPDAYYVCVGGPGRHGRDFTSAIEAQVAELGLTRHVRLVGACPHADLINWYNSADLYVLASSREGSPNALLEALACGLPAVSTRVGGAADELEKTGFGIMVRERTPQAISEAILLALARNWDHDAIHYSMQQRSWESTAKVICRLLAKILPTNKRCRLEGFLSRCS